MFYLGIDHHAKQLTVNLRDRDGNVVLRRQVSTRSGQVVQFFEQLTARCKFQERIVMLRYHHSH